MGGTTTSSDTVWGRLGRDLAIRRSDPLADARFPEAVLRFLAATRVGLVKEGILVNIRGMRRLTMGLRASDRIPFFFLHFFLFLFLLSISFLAFCLSLVLS